MDCNFHDYDKNNYFDIVRYNKDQAEKEKQETEDFNIEEYLLDDKDLEEIFLKEDCSNSE